MNCSVFAPVCSNERPPAVQDFAYVPARCATFPKTSVPPGRLPLVKVGQRPVREQRAARFDEALDVVDERIIAAVGHDDGLRE